ncbi:MAG: pyruvate kinase [Candidatus Dojkabacteria bacterium]|nr:MAG: pyruvate kinase [Candidatus Dojkabacteria bacterium]
MNTKILTTIGPSTWDPEVVKRVIEKGTSIARINASFADRAEMERVKGFYHTVSPKIAMAADTVGFKIRLSKQNPEITVKKGQIVKLSSKATKDDILELDYPRFEQDVKVGDKILIDDGIIQLKVKEVSATHITAVSRVSGLIKKGKTVSLPDTKLVFDPITPKDRINIQNAVDAGFDFLNVSFTTSAEDIRAVRSFIGNARISLIAKVENIEGVRNLDEILQVVDGLMIPRGDLAVELPLEKLLILQKEFSLKAAMYGKPVILATQILDSMRESRFPTRAEIMDVGNAVFDRADAIMLAQETAIGQYPITTVKTASKILGTAEKFLDRDCLFGDEVILEAASVNAKNPKTLETLEKALRETFYLANGFRFECNYGMDAYKTMEEFWYEFEPLVYLSKLRTPLHLMFESSDARALRQMSLLYGVHLHLK